MPVRSLIACLGLSAIAIPATASRAAAQGAPSGTFYVGTYSDKILVIDEQSMAVRDTIKLSIGIPTDMILSADRSRMYVLNPKLDEVEIVDIATRKATGKFTLSTPGTMVQIWGINVDPKERYAVLLVKSYAKKIDRYEISRPVLLRYDLAKRAVTDTIPWPQDEERDRAQIIFSPAGDLMYFFTSTDVLVYDAVTLKQVDRWDLAQSFYEEGIGRINANFGADPYDEPGFYTNLFRVSDPVNRRLLMGVARIDLANRSVDYYTLGPSVGTSFRLTPDKRRAYGIQSEVGNYQFWTFDLENRRVVGKTQFDGRPRMGLSVGTNGDRLYIYVAGNTIDVYETGTFRKLNTVTLDFDMTDTVFIPGRPAGAGR